VTDATHRKNPLKSRLSIPPSSDLYRREVTIPMSAQTADSNEWADIAPPVRNVADLWRVVPSENRVELAADVGK